MTPERWRQITEVFHAALARDTASRSALLDEMCKEDTALRVEVDALLAAHQEAGGFGEAPALTAPVESSRLRSGHALGPYRIEALIGAGGMGEVYRARDTRLDRAVAVKVLPVAVAGDSRYKQRLEREARALATLSHPHICPVFDVGEQDGVDYLVMEYLEGETLARRLLRGPLPLGEALRRAVEIADALDKAHRQGIVHRDLKPGNVMLTKGGAKLLDFGIAKLRTASAATQDAGVGTDAALTSQGMILGTLHYMAPEQLSGEEADSRTDIFAFGAVLHEMVTSRKAFEGRSRAEVMAAILEHQPVAVSALLPAAPPALDHLIKTCLAKDPDERWQSAADVGRDLAWLVGEGSTPVGGVAAMARTGAPSSRRVTLWAATLVVGLAVAVGAWRMGRQRTTDPPSVVRLDYQLPEGHEFRRADRPVMAFSTDGSHFVYNTTKGLYLRALRESEARLIPGTEEDLSNPLFSPDSQWVAYFAGGHLKKIAASGGTPISLCAAEAPFGASWGADDTIVFGQAGGIMRVAASGGAPRVVVPARDGELLDSPQVLPGGEWLLFTAARPKGTRDRTRWDTSEIVAQKIASGERKVVWAGGSAGRYVPTGHLVYAVKDVLFALPFDVEGMTVSGRAVPVVTDVQRAPVPRLHTGFAGYGFSDRGTLVFVRSEDVTSNRVLALVSRKGHVQRLDLAPGPYVNPRLSPDGARLLVQTLDRDGRGDVWVYELSGKSHIRQITLGGNSWHPIWAPDSRRVTFVSDRDGRPKLYWQRIDGQAAEPLALVEEGWPDSWSPHGPTLAYRTAQRRNDVGIWTLVPGAAPKPFHDLAGSDQSEGAFSPDGKWLAYTSNETGAEEIFLQPFPATGAKFRVTQRGGSFPIWSPDARELFYRRSFYSDLNRSHGARLFGVDITTEGSVEFGAERALPLEGFLVFFSYRDFDVTRDDGRFLMVFPEKPPAPPRIAVVQNWFEELKARVPVP
jgi:serine/threonine-protein kinase